MPYPDTELPGGQPRRDSSDLWRYAGMGFELAAGMIGLTLAGWWLDRHFGTHPRFLITGVVLGVVGGMYNFIRQAVQMMKRSQSSRGPHAGEDRERRHR